MIKKINVRNYRNKTLSIEMDNPKPTGIFIQSIEGLGYPQMSISTLKNIGYNPSEYKGTTVETRNLVFTFGITSDYNVEETRRKLYHFFPSMYPIDISIETDVIGIVYIKGYVENITPSVFEQQEIVQISLICPDPYFYTGGKVSFSTGPIKRNMGSRGIMPNFDPGNWFFEYNNRLIDVEIVSNNEEYEIERIQNIVSRELDAEDGTKLIVFSDDHHPKNLEIVLKCDGNSFQKMKFEYPNGKITIGTDWDWTVMPEIQHNEYQNCYFLIKNDPQEQNIYIVNSESLKMNSILDFIVLEGEFPNLEKGSNLFNVNFTGTFLVNTNVLNSNIYRLTGAGGYAKTNLGSSNRLYTPGNGYKLISKIYRDGTFGSTLPVYFGTMEIESKEVECYKDYNMKETVIKSASEVSLIETNDSMAYLTGAKQIINARGLCNMEKSGQSDSDNTNRGRFIIYVHKNPTSNKDKNFFNVPVENVFELEDGTVYAINIKYGLSVSYDNLIMSDSAFPLTVKITDLSISKEKFLQSLYETFQKDLETFVQTVERSELITRSYALVSFEDVYDGEVYVYKDNGESSIDVSYDERYEAI